MFVFFVACKDRVIFCVLLLIISFIVFSISRVFTFVYVFVNLIQDLLSWKGDDPITQAYVNHQKDLAVLAFPGLQEITSSSANSDIPKIEEKECAADVKMKNKKEENEDNIKHESKTIKQEVDKMTKELMEKQKEIESLKKKLIEVTKENCDLKQLVAKQQPQSRGRGGAFAKKSGSFKREFSPADEVVHGPDYVKDTGGDSRNDTPIDSRHGGDGSGDKCITDANKIQDRADTHAYVMTDDELRDLKRKLHGFRRNERPGRHGRNGRNGKNGRNERNERNERKKK